MLTNQRPADILPHQKLRLQSLRCHDLGTLTTWREPGSTHHLKQLCLIISNASRTAFPWILTFQHGPMPSCMSRQGEANFGPKSSWGPVVQMYGFYKLYFPKDLFRLGIAEILVVIDCNLINSRLGRECSRCTLWSYLAAILNSRLELDKDLKHQRPIVEVSRLKKAGSCEWAANRLMAFIATTRGLRNTLKFGISTNIMNIAKTADFVSRSAQMSFPCHAVRFWQVVHFSEEDRMLDVGDSNIRLPSVAQMA